MVRPDHSSRSFGFDALPSDESAFKVAVAYILCMCVQNNCAYFILFLHWSSIFVDFDSFLCNQDVTERRKASPASPGLRQSTWKSSEMDGQMKGEGVTNMFNRKQVLPAAIHTHEYLTFRGNINQHHVYFITALRAQNPSWKMSLMNNVKYRYVHVQKQRIHTQVPCFHHGLKGEKFDPIKYRFCRQQLWHKST